MKLRLLLRYIGIGFSSLASIFVGPTAQAKAPDVKETKSTKKARHDINQEADILFRYGVTEMQNPPDKGNDRYPWRKDIVTTTFWIGEQPTENNPVPNHKSSWDTKWAQNYGGTDSPKKSERTGEYIPTAFVPKQNPFYVALPYNDMSKAGHKSEASKVIPWFHEAYRGPQASVCKGRWIAIRRGVKICYAQWEDVGPFRTDHWEYVFGNARPLANLNKGAGLDVSPAVRDYLGMDGTDVTDWKFVDFDEVPSGPWARYGDNNTFVINRRASDRQVAELEHKLKAEVN